MIGLAATPFAAPRVSERQARVAVLAIAVLSTLAARIVAWRVLPDPLLRESTEEGWPP